MSLTALTYTVLAQTLVAVSIHDLKLPMLNLPIGPGITVSTSADDFAPIKQMRLVKFDAGKWAPFGELISAAGNY
jgi:hypothetical protein